MFDAGLAVAIGILSCAMAVLGAYLSLHPPKSKPRERGYVFIFIGIAFVSCVLIGWQAYRAYTAGEELRVIVQKTGKTVEELKSTQRESTEEKVQQSSYNREVREQLGRFVEEGLRIRASCSPGNDAGRKGWESRIRIYLRQNLDSSYRARFKASLFPSGNCFQEVSGQLAVLQKFIEELKD
jgi:hypothetical protein